VAGRIANGLLFSLPLRGVRVGVGVVSSLEIGAPMDFPLTLAIVCHGAAVAASASFSEKPSPAAAFLITQTSKLETQPPSRLTGAPGFGITSLTSRLP